MFIIQNLYVDDKRLTDVLRALAGIIIKMDAPRPVLNAGQTGKGIIKMMVPGDGSIISVVRAAVQKFAKGTELPISQIRTIIKVAGGDPKSTSYYLNKLKQEKVLKLKHRGTWVML